MRPRVASRSRSKCQMRKLLIRNATIVSLDSLLEDPAVLCEAGKITRVAFSSQLVRERADEVVDAGSTDSQLSHPSQRSGGGFGPGAGADIMSDSDPKTPLRQPSTPPARKKAPFSRLPEPKIRPSDPLFPPKTTKNHPFSAHFRAPAFGQIALTLPPRRLSPVTRQWSAISHSANDSITQFFNDSILPSPRPPPYIIRSPERLPLALAANSS